MDAFKLLTRSAKIKKPESTSAEGRSGKLPSDGQKASPQLFGQNDRGPQRQVELEREAPSKKRKRGQTNLREEAHVPAELDFFTGDATEANGKSLARDAERSTEFANRQGDLPVNVASPPEGKPLSQEESKRILKSHKVKIIRLDGLSPTAAALRNRSVGSNRKAKTDRGRSEQRSSTEGKSRTQELFPRPLLSFDELRPLYGISKRLAENISAQGYSIPTEVQLASLPLLLRKSEEDGTQHEKDLAATVTDDLGPANIDLIAVAPTGSGKTLAFLIPVFESLRRERRHKATEQAEPGTSDRKQPSGPRALIVVPTKELVAQVLNEGRKLSQGTGIRIAGVGKGMKVHAQHDTHVDGTDASDSDVDSGSGDDHHADEEDHKERTVKADILITTPMALLHAIESDETATASSLPSVTHLALDEADVLLDPLFREQTMAVWRACSNVSLRVTYWSATMGSSIEELIRSETQARRKARCSSTGPSWQLVRLVIGIKDSAVPNVSHRLVYAATEHGKLLALRQLLHPSKALARSMPPLRPPVLIFTQTIPRAVALHAELLYDIPPQAGGSSRIAVLHSDLSDTARSRVMAGFRTGEIWVIITTDLLSRGVDFRGVNAVVNYDVATSTAAYIHRGGRTGRAGRAGGVVVTLYTTEDIPHIRSIANIIAATEKLNRTSEGDGSQFPSWLLKALPKPTKAGKKELKRRGVASRRPPSTKTDEASGNTARRVAARISTKSGYDRRLQHRRQAAVRTKPLQSAVQPDGGVDEETEWNGFDD